MEPWLLDLSTSKPAERSSAGKPAYEPEIVDERSLHSLDAVLKRVGIVEGDRDRGVIPIEDGEGPARAQDPICLGQRTFGLRDVAQRGVHQHGVEVAVGELQRSPIAQLERCARPRRELLGPGDEDRRRIDPHRFAYVGQIGKHTGDGSGPAADLQHSSVSREVDFRQVGVEHRPLLAVARAQLQGPGQTLLCREIGVGDRGVDIRHGNPPLSNRIAT
jgi:hypothetical protein